MRNTLHARRNAGLLPWLRAASLACLLFLALAPLGFYPPPVVALAALITAVVSLLSPGAGVLIFLLVLAVPLSAGSAVAGAIFLLFGLGAVSFFGDDRGTAVLLIAVAYAATLLHAEWALAAFAGFALGSSEGAVVALLACLAIECAGVAFGLPQIGAIATGSLGRQAALIAPGALSRIADPLSFGWIGATVARTDVRSAVMAIGALDPLAAFAFQPVAWAAGAGVAGMLRRPMGDPRRRIMAFASMTAGTGVTGMLSIAVVRLTGAHVASTELVFALVVSLLAAVGAAVLAETVFGPVVIKAAADGVDVDDLLRTIAHAEDALATEHAVNRTVLITDMKSFARLTQELGSAEAAKLVQRHRDIVMPVFERHGGRGAAAGGDGMLAAFESPADALAAAIDMQRALDTFNVGRPGGREVSVRVGVAMGEVVLDRGGRPFLGDALNIAARIMGLADGGQVLTSSAVLDEAGTPAYGSASHGTFALRNIAEPLDVVEVLWRDGQQASAPPGAEPVQAYPPG